MRVKWFPTERQARSYASLFAHARKVSGLAPLEVGQDDTDWFVDNPDLNGEDARKPAPDPQVKKQRVASKSEPGKFYDLTLKRGVAVACECDSFKYRGTCGHIKRFNGEGIRR